MFKKFTTSIIIGAILLLFSTSASAIVRAQTYTGTFMGQYVYWVKLYNNSNYGVTCSLTASNGAQYRFRIPPWSASGWKRINNINAQYRYYCI